MKLSSGAGLRFWRSATGNWGSWQRAFQRRPLSWSALPLLFLAALYSQAQQIERTEELSPEALARLGFARAAEAEFLACPRSGWVWLSGSEAGIEAYASANGRIYAAQIPIPGNLESCEAIPGRLNIEEIHE